MRRLVLGAGLALALVHVSDVTHAAPPTVAQCLDASEQGQAMRDEGKLARAREQFAICSSTSCPAPVRTSCMKWLEGVVEQTPSIIIVVRDPNDRDVTDATVVIDRAARTKVTGQPVELNPGPHTLVVEAPGHETVRESIVATLAEKNRHVRVRLPRASTPSASERTPAPSTTEPSPSRGRSVPALTIGLGALALAGVGASLYLGLDARSDLSDLRASCRAGNTCNESDTDGIRTRLVIADVALGVSAVAAIAAVWIWLAQPSRPTATRSDLHLSRSGAGFVF